MSTKATSSALAFGLALALGGTAGAGGDYEQARLDAGAHARDLGVSREVEALLRTKEAEVAVRRRQGIGLLERFLESHPPSPETPEVLFQLAELRWEEAKATFLGEMAAYNAAVERCAGKPAANCRTSMPQLDLTASDGLYRRLLAEYPNFRKIDAVAYLYGFSLRQQGRTAESLTQFKKILKDHPQSRFRPDAFMAIAEARFYQDGDYQHALEAYEEVLKFPASPLYDLALFKTAWCHWKLGDADRAARRFKEVLDLGQGKEARAHQLTQEGQKRLAELKGEALDYLVQVFTEDERRGPREAFDFLASIGGAAYSRKVLVKLADTFFVQARYERAIESERFLLELDPYDEASPDRHERIVASLREMDEGKQAVLEMRKLADAYREGSDWAKHQEDAKVVRHAHELAGKLLRELAKTLHAEAQRVEQHQKHIDPDRYARAAEAYADYLQRFAGDAEAVEAQYLLGDIYLLKLKRNEAAGDAYLAVGRVKPVGKLHKEALLNAIAAYEKARREQPGGGAALGPADKKMGEAIDLYATLFPADPEIAGLLFKNGERAFDHGEYDEAVKRFGLVVEKYPKSPAAGAAGDKILESLNKARDFENVQGWARRLLKVPAFQARADQERLGKLVVDAGMKAGESKAESEPLAAAALFERVAAEFPSSPRAPQALANAAVMLARGGKPETAVERYGQLLDKYGASAEAPAAAWAAGRLYEQAALWDQAARLYQTLADRYPKDAHAPDALYNAGLLREHLGDAPRAIAAYGDYARRYKTQKDAADVAFHVGVVLDASGQKEAAARAFLEVARGARAVEALCRAGAALVEAGQDKRAGELLERAVALHRRTSTGAPATAPFAARARYLQGEILFHEFERLQLASDPRRLKKTLDEKSSLLERAKAIFVDVVTLKDPEWATAALYRIGDAYEHFAHALREAPTPAGLSADEQQVYRDELEKVVVVVEEKAIDAYQTGYKKALDLGVYNEFTQKLRAALGRLDDQQFPAENEARARPALAEPPAALPFVGAAAR
jgi:TolA-binding protein